MPIPGLDSLLTGIGSSGGQLIADLMSGGDREEIERLIQESMDEYGNVNPERLQQLVAHKQSTTEHDKVLGDPKLRGAQLKALETLGREYDEGGMTAEDRAAYERMRGASARAEKGQRDAIIERTQPGAGGRIALQALSSQASADRAGADATQIAGDARMRALQSMMGAGDLAGNIRGQDYGEAATRASAQDSINRFNVTNQLNVDQNNNQVRQGNFDNRMGVIGAQNSVRDQQIRRRQDEIERRRRYGQAAGSAIGGAVGLIPGVAKP